MIQKEILQIQNLSKRFLDDKKLALNDIHITINQSQILGIVGPDGAGKTTLMRLIAGLLLPTTGDIKINGLDSITNSEQVHELIGYMPQKFGLYEDLTVSQNLQLYADLRGLPTSEKKDRINQLLEFTTLSPFINRLAGALSGGMKQKLGLACALIKKPFLLLLDEPTVGVDPISRRELRKIVDALLKENIAVIWSTAYLDEAEQFNDVLLLNEGNCLYQGTPEILTNQMKGRSFLISEKGQNKRLLLSDLLQQKNLTDALLEGEGIRIVSKQATTDPVTSQFKETHPLLQIEPVSPRFEDAFIDLLGETVLGPSALTNQTTPLQIKDIPVIEAKSLIKKFGTFTAADHITFSVKPGEIFGLLGPNGAGKSTTFKMMCGLLKPTSGQAFVNGLNLQKAPSQARAQIGYMSQKFALYGNLSVNQNLNFFSGIYGLKREQRTDRIQEMVEIFALKPYLDTSADLLPLGFKQRLALACSLMHRPSVLFLDEPTSGVDPLTRREFWNHINGLVQKGVTVMVTTHFMDEAEYCDRIGLVYRSQMITIGTPTELKIQAKTNEQSNPTLEDAFITLIKRYDQEHPL